MAVKKPSTKLKTRKNRNGVLMTDVCFELEAEAVGKLEELVKKKNSTKAAEFRQAIQNHIDRELATCAAN